MNKNAAQDLSVQQKQFIIFTGRAGVSESRCESRIFIPSLLEKKLTCQRKVRAPEEAFLCNIIFEVNLQAT